MIRSIKGSATRRFVQTGRSRFSGLDAALARQRLAELNAAPSLDALSPLKSVGLHKLKGDRKVYWAITINGPWRLVFAFGTATPMRSRSSTIIEDIHVNQEEDIAESPPGGFRLPPVHPGTTLAAELHARGMTAHALALKLRVPANRLTEIIAGKRGISAETALRLGRYFGTGATFWANLQSQYELALTERRLGKRISAEVEEAA